MANFTDPTYVNTTTSVTPSRDSLSFLRQRAAGGYSPTFDAAKKRQGLASMQMADQSARGTAGTQAGLWDQLSKGRGLMRGGARERIALPNGDVERSNIEAMSGLYSKRGAEQVGNLGAAAQMEGLVGQQEATNAWTEMANKLRENDANLDAYTNQARIYGGYLASRGGR